MYHKRLVEEKVQEAFKHFKVVLVTGTRQVGKTTLLKNLFPHIMYVAFDPIIDVHDARAHPELFIKTFKTPLILDEIQFVPALLSSIKRHVDLSDQTGQYLMTGSQNLALLKTSSESLFGRIGIIQLEHMSLLEQADMTTNSNHNWLEAYLQNPNSFGETTVQTFNEANLLEAIWKGSFPGILSKPASIVNQFFTGYIRTYVEQDVRTAGALTNLGQFESFMRLAAALTAQEINYTQLGREIGLNNKIAQEWLALLSQTYQWRTIQPYYGNVIKRVAKRPKGYITDTGLACYLFRINSPLDVSGHPQFGALFETWVVNHIHQLATQLSLPPIMYHWRSSNKAEVDLILEYNGWLYPIEIKLSAHVTRRNTSGISAFRKTYPHYKIACGLVIYAGSEFYPLNEHDYAFPWNAFVK